MNITHIKTIGYYEINNVDEFWYEDSKFENCYIITVDDIDDMIASRQSDYDNDAIVGMPFATLDAALAYIDAAKQHNQA